MSAERPEGGGALSGLKVVDLTMMLAGPYCSMMLADQGADVIKVEPPSGDVTRGLGPFQPEDHARYFGGYFQSINRNKRSIVLDLKLAQDREILFELVRGADVLIENYRAGVMDRLDLSFERFRAENPRLVYACLRGFGDPRSGASPYVDWPAYDVVAQAMGGVMAITGTPGEHPLKVGPGIGDIVPAMILSFAILAALRHADHTGLGQFVDIGMYDAMIALCERPIYQYSYEKIISQREGNFHPLLCPFGLFPARDGWISIAAHQDSFWKILSARMGQPELGVHPDYATNASRVRLSVSVNKLIADWTKTRTRAEIMSELGGMVPVGPVNDAEDVWNDPHVAARGLLSTVAQPGSSRDAIIVNTPIRMSKTQGGVRHRAPLLDEQRAEILDELERSRKSRGRITGDAE